VLADYFHVEQIKKTNFAPQNYGVGLTDYSSNLRTINCRHLLTIYISLLKRPNRERFAQTASIGVPRAFDPRATDIALAHPRPRTCGGQDDLCGVANSARDPCTPVTAHHL